MGFELLLLCALIFIFIVSFCGLLQKIRQSYERERIIADQVLRREQQQRNSNDSFEHVFQNTGYVGDGDGGIFPAAPPPYSQVGPPPKYDDIIKDGISVVVVRSNQSESPPGAMPPPPPPQLPTAPPSYVIAISSSSVHAPGNPAVT